MRNRGYVVTAAGLGLNLALGVLYAWSMFSKQLTEPVVRGGFGWSRAAATLPYTIAIACFAIMMVPAGRLQDRFGPRVVATAGAVLCGVGLFVASQGSATAVWPVIVGFGLLAGPGLGLGYAAATPAAVKWFGSHRKGVVTGIVVAGFGLAPVYIAPLAKYLLTTYGIGNAFAILGGVFLVVATGAAQLITDPPKDYVAPRPAATTKAAGPGVDFGWRDMMRTPAFYALFLQFACAATAGLMIIGHMAKIVAIQSGNSVQAGFFFVALLAVFNAGGRVLAGLASDIIGRVSAMIFVFIMQALAMFFFAQFTTTAAFVFGAAIVGLNYGACLSLFPATTADYWGVKNLGLNYGIVFVAWGVGGVVGPMLASFIADATGSYATAYTVAGVLCIVASLLAVASHIRVSFGNEQRRPTIIYGKRAAELNRLPPERKAA